MEPQSVVCKSFEDAAEGDLSFCFGLGCVFSEYSTVHDLALSICEDIESAVDGFRVGGRSREEQDEDEKD
jgi:hypothetical protein